DCDAAVEGWSKLNSDAAADFDSEVSRDAAAIAPTVTWGISPEHALPIDASVPDPAREPDPVRARELADTLQYMNLRPGTKLTAIAVDRVFIGSAPPPPPEPCPPAAARPVGSPTEGPGPR